MRNYHIQLINEHNKKQNEEVEKAQKGQSPSSNQIHGPNIPPSSTYDY